MQKSIWDEDIVYEDMPSLENDIECDILIIGGGIAGLSAALQLKDEPYNIVLIDKGKLGGGVTSKTTGKLTYMQGDIYSKIEKIYNLKMAKNYMESQVHAIKLVMNNIKKYKIKCDFEKVDSYVFENSGSDLNKERKILNKIGIKYYDKKELPLNFPCNDAFYVKDTAVFNPIKYLMSIRDIIKNNIKIYENTRAIDLDIDDDKYIIKTNKGSIRAIKVIVCTHYPFFVVPGLMPFKLHQERSYVVISKDKNNFFSAINIDKPSLSLRYYHDYLLLGGFSHNLSDKLDYTLEQDKLINFYEKYVQNEILYSWQVHDNMTTDYMPFIGKLNLKHPNLLIATGFNKWGMTNGALAGEILGDIVLNKYNKYENLFCPYRKTNFNRIINSFINNFKIGRTYIGTKLFEIKLDKAFITKINGIKCGVYIDKSGNKHICKNICPHLKCNLVFNESCKTWDCPCHGSRFDIDGNLIEGPSVFSIKLENNIKKM